MKRTTLALATLITGAGLALGAAAQTGTEKPAAAKDAAMQGCKHGDGKADCPMHEGKHRDGKHHEGKHHEGKHHAGMDGMGHHGKDRHGKGHHGKGEGCKHDGAKADAAVKHECMAQKDAQKDAKK
ncbi:MAG: hypothetical protein SF172_00295 [Burkholderiales bacterium]|nr:hypothetical protein [Burkholderiales bacterium]